MIRVCVIQSLSTCPFICETRYTESDRISEETPISDRLEDKLRELLPPQDADAWIAQLPALRTIRNFDLKQKRILHVISSEELKDYLCELRFALIFKSLDFEVEAESEGGKGPDFLVERDGSSMLLECTRFRKVYPGPSEANLDDTSSLMKPYGNGRRDTEKAFNKIINKMPQISGDISMICIWNDDNELEEIEVNLAVQNIIFDVASKKYRVPEGLQAIIYGSEWIAAGSWKQLHCYPLKTTGSPLTEWLHELSQVEVNRALAVSGGHI